MLTGLERWRITLFSQLALIFQFWVHYFGKLKFCFGKQKLTSLMFHFCVCIWKLFPALFHIICASNAEQSFTTIISLCISLVQWLFVLVEKHQVKFCMAETSNLKSIFLDITTKLCFACNVMKFCKDSTLLPRVCYLIDFADTASTVLNFLSRAKLISSL